MKQLLSLFLFLLPCLAWAQYPSNGNQKITLGEQTTADGLIWRGVVATDTVRKPSVDTMAYMVLDTTTNIIWHYKKATSNAWLRVGGSISSGLTGTLPVANGGTNTSTAFTAGSIVFAGSGGTYTQDNSGLFWDNTNNRLGINKSNPTWTFQVNSDLVLPLYISSTAEASILGINNNSSGNGNPQFKFYIDEIGKYSFGVDDSDNDKFKIGTTDLSTDTRITIDGSNIGINTQSPNTALHVVGNARITAMNGIGDIGADANGVLQAATSDMNLKNTIENSPFGLNEILLLKPVTFLYNDTDRKIDSDVKEVGFIAQDVFDIIPNAVSSTGMGDLQLDYRAITATLTKAIQEQNLLIKALEQRIINLENK
jgi:hypothetical protein